MTVDSAAPRRKKPFISANQVTFARLALLPIGCWLLYQGTTGQTVALVFMTIVGCTDFVDGWLARRYGPTVLGGLMDPIADKVFIAVTLLPMIDLEWLPYWVVMLIFLREFVITSARTTYSRRHVTLKTTYLAKVKTWYQMITGGLIFLLRISPASMRWVTLGGMLGPGLIGLIVAFILTKRIWKGGVVFLFSFGALFVIAWLVPPQPLILGLAWTTIAITWASGGVYLFGLRELKGRGLDMDDVIRLFGAIALPVLACLILGRRQIAAWPIFITVAIEFAIGGLDNLLAHHELLPSWTGWAARVVPQAGLLGAALWLERTGHPPQLAFYATLGAMGVTAISAAVLFYRQRDVYLGARADAPIK